MKRIRGFAVVDLMAVIPVVMVLAMLLFPVLWRSKEARRRTLCAAHLSHLGRAFAQYLAEYGCYTPAYGGVIDLGWGKGKGWMDRLFPYVDAKADGRGPGYPENANSKRTEIFRCPSAATWAVDDSKYLSGYIFNSRLYMDSPKGKYHLTRLRFPQKVIVLYDRNQWTGAPSDADMTDEWGNVGTSFSDLWGPGGLWYYFYGGPDFSGPHQGGYNILFADSHVKWFGQWVKGKMTRHAKQ